MTRYLIVFVTGSFAITCSEPRPIEPPVCGNSIVESGFPRGEIPGEECDDGNVMGGDGCTADCRVEFCGDGVVNNQQAPTDTATGTWCGPAGDGEVCRTYCDTNTAPDSPTGELCDDGNDVDGDGCSSDCQSLETCGNGRVDAASGEECDDSNTRDGDGCNASCVREACGDGVVNNNDPSTPRVDELCDDGNNVDGDGCSRDCLSREICGDGYLDRDAGEECDHPGAFCNSDCTLSDAAVFVDRVNGSNNNPGTRDEPLLTIAAGMTLAAASSPPRPVVVAEGAYVGQIAVAPGVSLFGGFSGIPDWIRDPREFETEIRAPSPAVEAQGILDATMIDGVTIRSDSAPAGESSIAVLVVNSEELTFRDVFIESGRGGAGVAGQDGGSGTAGQDGTCGEVGCEDSIFPCNSCDRPVPGVAGASTCDMPGGTGGAPGYAEAPGESGASGAGDTPGGAGGEGSGGSDGQSGSNGSDGLIGVDGVGGDRLGGFSEAGYAPSDGQLGGEGFSGHGGGGGGGGGGGVEDCDSFGSAGGGGGAGGCGGLGGAGGAGGGGSFGVLLIDSVVRFESSHIVATVGGDGGDGGAGGLGGAGGQGGCGGPYGGAGEQDDATNGGPGGDGGAGGVGGRGGGGGGGPAISLVCAGSNVSIANAVDTVFNACLAGEGGSASGTDGLNAGTLNCGL